MQFKVTNSEVEGQHALVFVTPLRIKKSKVLPAVVLSILSGLLFALLLKWNKKFFIRFCFSECDEAVATHFVVSTQNEEEYICKKKIAKNPYFTFRLLNYEFNSLSKSYEPIQFLSEPSSVEQLEEKSAKISQHLKQILYGRSEIKIPIVPLHVYLFDELTGPFYILQYFTVVLWIIEGFLLFSLVLLGTSFFCLLANYVLLRRSRLKLQQLASNNQKVSLQDGFMIQGADLLPGDRLLVVDGLKLSCDCLLIQGDVMINEATLTGESIPVPKQAIDAVTKISIEKASTHILFEGTSVVKASTYQQNVALVLRTGFSSLRGQYFRNVLFPQRESRRFYVQACKFLAGVAVIVIFTYLLMLIRLIPMNFSPLLLIIRFFDALTWIIPPALPIFFSYAQGFALIKLVRQDVYGSNPAKTEMAGRVDTVCFDKTGTLTHIGLIGKECYPNTPQVKRVMACCHHLLEVNGTLVGDPLEVEMQKLSGWQLSFSNKQQYFISSFEDEALEVVKINEFTSARQFMSVVAYRQATKQYFLLAKGSPETLARKSRTQIADFQSVLDNYTYNGLRVIGLAQREMANQGDDAESNFEFLGFFMLENRLKPDTPNVIQQLSQANLAIRVISGDNALTTSHCAEQANIIKSRSSLVILDYNNATDNLIVKDFTGMVDQNKNENSIQQSSNALSIVQLEAVYKNIDADFAITGNVWELIFQQKSQNFTLDSIHEQVLSKSELMGTVLRKTKIFSRMKPNQKKEVVIALQKQGRSVMMVGDGANDCSAIAQAQVGVSFSASDASYTAPFSTQNDSIDCTIKILCQGRATIAIIIEIFQYYIVVSVLKFVCTMCMMFEAENFSDFQFIYINYMSSIPYLFFLVLSLSVNQLVNYVPNDDMFRLPNQLKIYNQLFFTTLGFIIISVIVINDSDVAYQAIPDYISQYLRTGSLNSAIFLGCLFYFMTIGMQLYISSPFKKAYLSNIPLSIWTGLCFGLAILLIIDNSLGGWLNVVKLNEYVFEGFNWVLLAILITTTLGSWVGNALLTHRYPTSSRLDKF